MKNWKLYIVMLLVSVLLGGCASSTNLTDEETDMFAEYISKEVLKRDKYYDQELLTQEYNSKEEVADNQTTVATPNDQNSTKEPIKLNQVNKKPTSNQVKATLNEVLGTASIEVSYKNAKLYDSYPDTEENYFVISAKEGYRLLVVSFKIKNTKNKDVGYSMLTEHVKYKLVMENGSEYSPLLTLLEDDLQFINKVIPAEDTEKGVLVFRIDEKEEKSKGILQITEDSKVVSIDIE